ncbi:MAG: response regulator [Planctomycetota bacterium]|jgi:CheY-like chemotaxis protein
MHLLLVENDPTWIGDLEAAIAEIQPPVTVHTVRSRDAAIQAVDGGGFDVILCDLSIPTTEGGLDEDRRHGLAVHAHVTQVAPGTPVILLSGYFDLDLVEDLWAQAPRDDVFGSGTERVLLTPIQKKHLSKCISLLAELAAEIRELQNVELDPQEGGELRPVDSRILRIFARRVSGRRVEVKPIGGGLSASRTFRVVVREGGGAIVATAFGKVASLSDVLDEQHRARNRVAATLGIGEVVSEFGLVKSGAGGFGGVFYPFAEGHRPLIEIVENDAGRATAVVHAVKGVEGAWHETAPHQETTVGEIRRRCVGESLMKGLRF